MGLEAGFAHVACCEHAGGLPRANDWSLGPGHGAAYKVKQSVPKNDTALLICHLLRFRRS